MILLLLSQLYSCCLDIDPPKKRLPGGPAVSASSYHLISSDVFNNSRCFKRPFCHSMSQKCAVFFNLSRGTTTSLARLAVLVLCVLFEAHLVVLHGRKFHAQLSLWTILHSEVVPLEHGPGFCDAPQHATPTSCWSMFTLRCLQLSQRLKLSIMLCAPSLNLTVGFD